MKAVRICPTSERFLASYGTKRCAPADRARALRDTVRMSIRASVHCMAATLAAAALAGAAPVRADEATHAGPPAAKAGLDLSGHKRVGKASFYARRFFGRTMADGTPMDPAEDNAASKTLPLGTRARVTNLETRQCAVVPIQARAPHGKGRTVVL